MPVWLQFPLEIEEGWPPVAVESLPFEKVPCEGMPNGYRALTAPLYVRGMSVGDIIMVQVDAAGLVQSWRHLHQSSHSTVWLLRMRATELDLGLEALRRLGCHTVSAPQLSSYAIDVPPSVALAQVDAIIDTFDPEAVAAAFPSLRHPD
ncbi:DUF4265 domain-containing protein [Nitrospirillum amazonense]|uniref:DUF4265 domain-containing protein n=1 Tax=Nitrospirillum amazonense TaxID=28077 RepID=UPI002DD4398D|nr:DUF4265 domain-containing protein [Nitrospirillum amazonense]MEC4595260.1 DUF4265 domain-containing protein [Nitrospirillum amazonense]